METDKEWIKKVKEEALKFRRKKLIENPKSKCLILREWLRRHEKNAF